MPRWNRRAAMLIYSSSLLRYGLRRAMRPFVWQVSHAVSQRDERRRHHRIVIARAIYASEP